MFQYTAVNNVIIIELNFTTSLIKSLRKVTGLKWT